MRISSSLSVTAILLATALTSCSTVPAPRTVHFDVEWIRSTLAKENYGYRHAERTAPTIDGNIAYQGNGIDGFVALDKKSGAQIWRTDIRNGVESGSATDADFVFFGASDGQFYALDKLTGKILWTFPTRVENLSAPTVAGGVVYFLAGNNVVYALDEKTGKQIWLYNRGDASSLSIRGGTKPAIYKGTAYVGFSDGYLAALNTHDGALIWERKLTSNLKFVDVDATPVVDDSSIWVSSFDGSLFCLSRTDGQVQWRLDDGGSAAVAINGDTLYYASLTQNVYALRKKTGAQIWKYTYEEKNGVPTQPVLYKGLVIFGVSDGDLIALSEATGKPLATYRTGTGVFANPVIDPQTGSLYVYSNQANLHSLKVAWSRSADVLDWHHQQKDKNP